MTWKLNDKNIWERKCRHCGGTGKVQIPWGSCCHGDEMEDVDHPGNGSKDGLGWQMTRCNVCGRVWLRFWDTTGMESIDVPAPELLGDKIPPVEWRYEKAQEMVFRRP